MPYLAGNRCCFMRALREPPIRYTQRSRTKVATPGWKHFVRKYFCYSVWATFPKRMSSERWKRIEQVYYSVIASPASRAAILEQLCPEDAEIRRQVESLLNAREQAGSFLSQAELEDQIVGLFGESRLIGQTLGHYEIVSMIGAGAMGEVYLARDTRLAREVALKVLPARFTLDALRVTRFLREAKAASALNHPNIITIYDVDEIGETWFMIAEFVDGVTLRQRFATGGMDVTEALDMAIQCARALRAAHGAGIVHRDIKPENIMLRPDGVVKIVDFGLARMAESGTKGADVTQAGAVIGTPRYMSPEQARGEKLDPRTDIFSLGAVLYEAVTGRPAFSGATTAEVFAALLGSTPCPASECMTGIPARLNTVLSKALRKDPGARYQTIREFQADLEDLKEHPETRAVTLPKVQQVSRFRGRRWIAPALVIAAAFAIILLAAIAFERMARSRNQADAPPLSVVPLTSFQGYKDFTSISPDGSQVAFSWNGGAGGSGGKPVRNIYIKKIGPHEPYRLTFASQDERLPVWSPDGHYIAFCRALILEPAATRYAILIVPSSGGQERKIAEGGMGVSWAPDGRTLAIAGEPAKSSGISLLSIETGARREITHPHAYFDTLPVFSPDGKWIAFTRNFGFSAREIFVVSANGGAEKQLTFDRQPTYGAAWTADSREIVFASNRGRGGESLWRVPAKGGVPRRVSATLEGSFYPSISRQGNQLAYTQSFKDTNVYAFEGPGFNDKRTAPGYFLERKLLINSSHRDDSPSISPQGDRIAFVSKRTGNEEIWACDRSGGSPTQLTFFNGPNTGTPRWSPDGHWIAFDSLAAGNSNIYIISAQGGSPRQLTTGPGSNFMPSWSPGGNWIYFKSDRSGTDQIWKIAAQGGKAVQVTRSGASEAFASRDGTLVYFRKRSWGAIWTVPANGGPEKPLRGLEGYDRIFRSWGILDEGIYFMSREDTPHQNVRFYSFATGRVTTIATLNRDPIWDYPDVALSNDGQLLLAACLDQEVNDLMLIENFR